MAGLTGMEKFSHLEDKVYRIIEEYKTLAQTNENLERELTAAHRELSSAREENQRLESQMERLQNEREVIKIKVEAMLDAIAILDLEPAESLKK